MKAYFFQRFFWTFQTDVYIKPFQMGHPSARHSPFATSQWLFVVLEGEPGLILGSDSDDGESSRFFSFIWTAHPLLILLNLSYSKSSEWISCKQQQTLALRLKILLGTLHLELELELIFSMQSGKLGMHLKTSSRNEELFVLQFFIKKIREWNFTGLFLAL